jgi:hypothetical protein
MNHWNVCPRCGGEGSYVNPAIDGHGITAEEMHDLGDDFRDDYMAGVYDVPCDVCKGRRVVTDEELKDYEDGAEARAEMAAEARMMGGL